MNNTLLWIIGGMFANMVMGLLVMSSVDDENRSLCKWVHHTHAPYPSLGVAVVHMFILWPLVMNLWPVVTWMFLRRKG